MCNITSAQLTDILRKMDAEACKSAQKAAETDSTVRVFAYKSAELAMREAMSIFVYSIGPENFEGKPFIDFRIPMQQEYS